MLLEKNFWKILYLLCVSQLKASLMMSADEVNILHSIMPIEEEVDNNINTPLFDLEHTEKILFLSAILYFSPSHWTVWINDRTYTADDTEDKILKIRKVTNQYVLLQIKDKARKIIKLRANQSLLLPKRNIIDGDIRQESSKILLP